MTSVRAIERFGVVGAGTVGAGIAQTAAMAGMLTVVTDAAPPALAHAEERILAALAKGVATDRWSRADADAALGRLTFTDDAGEPTDFDAGGARLAEAISTDYAGKNVLLIGVLKAAVFLLADLMRQLEVDREVDSVAVSSYGSSTGAGHHRLDETHRRPGVKKCMPTTRSGCGTASAIAPTSNEQVLLARTASSPHHSARPWRTACSSTSRSGTASTARPDRVERAGRAPITSGLGCAPSAPSAVRSATGLRRGWRMPSLLPIGRR